MSHIRCKVKSVFGCVCANRCECEAYSGGRTYEIDCVSIDPVSIIWERMIEQNPSIRERNVKPFLYYKREILDLERRVINYDIADGSEIRCIMPPSLCCSKPFRKAPPQPDDPEKGSEKIQVSTPQAPTQKEMGASTLSTEKV